MSDKNGGDDFMAEMAQFLKPGDFQRPSEGIDQSKKLKLKKAKKDKKEKKVKLSDKPIWVIGHESLVHES